MGGTVSPVFVIYDITDLHISRREIFVVKVYHAGSRPDLGLVRVFSASSSGTTSQALAARDRNFGSALDFFCTFGFLYKVEKE